VSGFESVEGLFTAGCQIDAVFAGTDEVAIGILNVLHRRGLKVPQDVAIASIDNSDFSAFTIPPLTTVDVPKGEIGRHAVEILLSDTAHRASSAFSITVPTRLIVRESSS
jgi:LacI family transcriptional regulator